MAPKKNWKKQKNKSKKNKRKKGIRKKKMTKTMTINKKRKQKEKRLSGGKGIDKTIFRLQRDRSEGKGGNQALPWSFALGCGNQRAGLFFWPASLWLSA